MAYKLPIRKETASKRTIARTIQRIFCGNDGTFTALFTFPPQHFEADYMIAFMPADLGISSKNYEPINVSSSQSKANRKTINQCSTSCRMSAPEF